jgi:hypothetical protein
MSRPEDGAGWKSAARGESAWQQDRDEVAARNEAARKAGRHRRTAEEREREVARKAKEARQEASLLGRPRKS